MKFYISLLLIFWSIAFNAEASSFCRGKTRINYTPIESRYQNGVFFKVGKCGEVPSFILGTVHSDDPEILQLASPAFNILAQAKAAGFEYVEPVNAAELTQKFLFFDSASKQTLPALIGDEAFQYLAPKLQRKAGIAQEDAQYLKPWAAAIILQYPPSVGDGVVLDMRLQQTAAEQKIPLFGLETMEQQFNIFDSLPQNLQTEMLQDALAYDSAEALNQELIAAYKAADLRTIYRLSNATFAKMKNRDLAAILETRLLTQRNHRMAKKMREPLKQGGQFIAVGALHLLGKTGILAMLERKGYLVQALP